ncbi:MAG TPA: hypothetical protein GXZ30_06860 [Propionibacterium sp.]|jgi:hypothetical protein|nr:hypothetical protein [Propionibacterium sp.]
MAASPLPRRWFLPSAIVALAALFAVGASVTWLVSMLEAPDTRVFAWPFVGAIVACLILTVAIPILQTRTVPRWARVALPLFVGVFAIVAAAAVWLLTLLLACDVDGVCRPADTWQALPSLIVCGILAASGPGLAALVSAPHGEWRGRFWAATAVFGLVGFGIAMGAWVELGIYALS